MKPIMLSFLLILVLVVPAMAQPKPNVVDGGNRWEITFFDDTSPVHTQWATQGICFLPYAVTGTGISGKWYSDTFPNWNGLYYQEGDRVTMTGDYAQNVGHDGIEFDIAGVSFPSLATGHWKEWRENPGYGIIIGWGNARMVRVSKCNLAGSAEDAREFSRNLPLRMLRNGMGIADSPSQPGQLPSEDR